MYKCIYSLKSEPEAHFKEREHIFPKTIGGVNTLPLGTVSDEVNALFSPLEKDFVKNTPFIQLGKMFYGPLGRKKHDKKDNVRVMMSRESKKWKLGYIFEGKPYPIPQFSIPCTILEKDCKGKKQIAATIPYDKDGISIANTIAEQLIQDIRACLNTIEKNSPRIRPQIRPTPKDSTEILVGYYRKNLFLGIPQIKDDNKRDEYINHVLNCLKTMLQTAKRENGRPKYDKELISIDIKWVIDIKVICRVVAKIAFNCLAKLYGQDFVLEKCFNKFRRAILTGENIEKYIRISALGNSEIKIQKCLPLPLLNISPHCHSFICIQINSRLEGYLNFYGFQSYRIIFTDEVPLNFKSYPSFFVCDWEKQKEYDTNDFIKNLIERENQALNM